MSKQRFTPEEIARSLRVCHGAAASCEGCICADGRVQRSPAECRELEIWAADLIEEQAKRIAELEEQARWIPVSERLPEVDEDDVEVLVMIKGAKESTTLYVNDEGEFYAPDGNGGTFYLVTHWKSMPKGPEVDA